MSLESTFELVNLLKSVDLPELVYPTRATTGTLFFCLLYLWIFLIEIIFLIFFLICLFSLLIVFYPILICFSPGPPIKPAPPLCLSKCVQDLTSLLFLKLKTS